MTSLREIRGKHSFRALNLIFENFIPSLQKSFLPSPQKKFPCFVNGSLFHPVWALNRELKRGKKEEIAWVIDLVRAGSESQCLEEDGLQLMLLRGGSSDGPHLVQFHLLYRYRKPPYCSQNCFGVVPKRKLVRSKAGGAKKVLVY